MFCKKCGSILLPKSGILVCSRCGAKSSDAPTKITQKFSEKKSLEVVSEGADNILPLGDANCDKCGHKKAFFWDVQTRSADEPSTRFFRCEKCKHTWRDYDSR